MPYPPPAQVLLVGTFHFGATDDAIQVDFDVWSERRQREIIEVAERLAGFAPTLIAVEAEPANKPRLHKRYKAFLDGELNLEGNEIEQLGFRLAARCGLVELVPVDHQLELPFDSVLEWAEKNEPGFVEEFWSTIRERERLDNQLVAASNLADSLRHFNHPDVAARDHALYQRLASVGTQENPIGADLLTAWYERNVRICTNLLRFAEPGARLVLLIGSGHLAILRELIRSSTDCTLVELAEFLPTRT